MDKPEEKVPLFGNWPSWYLFVMGVLFLLILLFYWFTRSYA